jgi:ligand-binding SRPBCC domain-containing protein
LIGYGQQVQWRARHFGLWFHMTVSITEMKQPSYFQDAMVKGPFRYFRHDHTFTQTNTATLMVDCVEFASPGRTLGVLVDFFLVRRHLKRFLQTRNLALKAAAETDQWRDYLSAQE